MNNKPKALTLTEILEIEVSKNPESLKELMKWIEIKQREEQERLKSTAYKDIETRLNECYRLIDECKKLAEATDTDFTLSVAYGMGGTYGKWDDDKFRWRSSSENC